MTVYVAYSDESATPDNDGPFIVGGYVTPALAWPDFSKKWAENVLLPAPEIPYMHVVELRSKVFRAKHGLTWEDNLAKVAAASKTIYDHKDVWACFGAISRQKLQEIYRKIEKSGRRYQEFLKEPDYMCFLSYAFYLIAHVSDLRPEVTRIDFVVSKKQRVSHYYSKFQEEMRDFLNDYNPALGKLVGDLIPANMEDRVPLQAADVLCWHLQKHYSNAVEPEDVSNLNLLMESSGTGHTWTEKELEEFASNITRA